MVLLAEPGQIDDNDRHTPGLSRSTQLCQHSLGAYSAVNDLCENLKPRMDHDGWTPACAHMTHPLLTLAHREINAYYPQYSRQLTKWDTASVEEIKGLCLKNTDDTKLKDLLDFVFGFQY